MSNPDVYTDLFELSLREICDRSQKPMLITDVQITRRTTVHYLLLPSDRSYETYKSIAECIQRCVAAGHHTLVCVWFDLDAKPCYVELAISTDTLF